MSSHYIELHSILHSVLQCTTLNLVYAVAAGNLSDPMPVSLETSKSQLRIPKLQQVLEWLALLFDAHITSFHRQPGSVKVCFLFLLLFFLLMHCAPLPLLLIYALLISSVESSPAFFVIDILKLPCVAHLALYIRQSCCGERMHHIRALCSCISAAISAYENVHCHRGVMAQNQCACIHIVQALTSSFI